MKTENKSNNQLNTLLNEVKTQHDEVKADLLEKLKEMDRLEEQYREVLEEVKKRYDI
jgi:hypothetical protein